jgi:hypothetical protein
MRCICDVRRPVWIDSGLSRRRLDFIPATFYAALNARVQLKVAAREQTNASRPDLEYSRPDYCETVSSCKRWIVVDTRFLLGSLDLRNTCFLSGRFASISLRRDS